MRTIPLALVLVACGTQLPVGWEDAVSVPLEQADCDGSPYDEHEELVTVIPREQAIDVFYDQAHFRCEQDVEAFARIETGRVDVLVQPIDMSPRVVAACDCLYDLTIEVQGVPSGSTEVNVYRRWDDLNNDNEPVAIGFETVLVGG